MSKNVQLTLVVSNRGDQGIPKDVANHSTSSRISSR
ncbi:hypothetical protein pb186bvf_019633 [Paramecium bursaria]